MTVDEHASFRVIPEVLAAPVLGNLPNTLADLAATFDAGPAIQPSVRKIAFSGPGIDSYRHSCRVELFATPD
jgi:hypothetical protein